MEGDNERRRSFVNKKTAPYIFAANDTSVRSIHGISGN